MTTQLYAGPFANTEYQTGSPRWREHSRVLHDYLRRDMRDAEVQQKRLYPKNWDKHVLRVVPFVWALARELATAYIQEPGRRWVGLDGSPLPASTVTLIEDLYRRARVNRVMRNAHRQLVALNNATVWVWPVATSGDVSLTLVPPHEQEVQMAGPFGLHEDDVSSWRFRVPVPVPGDPQLHTYAVAEVTSTRATWVDGTGELRGRGVYTTDGSNPMGMVPVAMMRGTEPGPGEWWAPVPEDILYAQRAVDHDMTDLGTVARLQAFGQPVWKGAGPKDQSLELGPETAVRVDPDGDFSFAQADPKLEGYVLEVKEYLTGVVGMNGLNPATFMKSTGITAVAKQMELIDRESYRKEHLEILRAAEQRLYDVIRAQVNWMRGGVEVFPAARVEVEYREPILPVDPLHDMQALELAIRLGQTSEARARALRDGTSVEEAARRIDEERATTSTPAPEVGEQTETPAPVEGDAGSPPALDAEGDVQRAALNGAQVTALQGLVQAVADGLLPAGSARAVILASFPVDMATVDAMLAPLATFTPRPAAPAVMPFGAPQATPVEDVEDDGEEVEA
jgi:hypothetical protein